MSPSLLHEWGRSSPGPSGSHSLRPAAAAGPVCVGGLRRLARPRPCLAPRAQRWPLLRGAFGRGSQKTPRFAHRERLGSALPGAKQPPLPAGSPRSLLPGGAPGRLFQFLSVYPESLASAHRQRFR